MLLVWDNPTQPDLHETPEGVSQGRMLTRKHWMSSLPQNCSTYGRLFVILPSLYSNQTDLDLTDLVTKAELEMKK